MPKIYQILLMALFISSCANNLEKRTYVNYKIKDSRNAIKSSYEKITLEEAKALLGSFDKANHDLAVAASNDHEIKLYMSSVCTEKCQYIVSVYAPCSGSTEYYFELLNSTPSFNFIGKEISSEECCFGPRKSWLRRVLHI